MAFKSAEEIEQNVAAEEEQSFFTSGTEAKYFRPWFASGENAYTDRDGNAKGWHFGIERMPPDLLAIFRQLEEDGKAYAATVQHAGDERNPQGVEKLYYVLKEPRFYIMTHGTPSAWAIKKEESKRIGLVLGSRSVFKPRDTPKPTLSTGGVTSVLAVELTLLDAGWLTDDENAAPRLLNLQIGGLTGKEFLTALKVHSELMETARDKWHVPQSQLQYYAYAQVITTTAKKVQHGSGAKMRMVYGVQSGHPSKDKWTLDYFKSLKCAPEVFDLLRPFMVQDRQIGGEVIDWCREQVQALLDNQKEYTSPSGKEPAYGVQYLDNDHWLLLREAVQDDMLRRDGGQQETRVSTVSPVEELIGQIDTALRFFIKEEKELAPGSPNADEKIHKIAVQGRGFCEQALILSNNEGDLSQNELVKKLTLELQKIGKLRTQVAQSVPF